MDDSNPTSGLSALESIYIKNDCADNSVNNTEICETIRTIIFFTTTDYYTNKIFYPLTAILILIGTILNIYSLYYFLKMKRRNSQNIYLSIISITDTIDLHINFTLPMIRQSVKFDDYFRNSIQLCRLTGILTEFFLIFSTWIILLLIIERLRYILQSRRSSSLHAQRQAKISILILTIIVTLLSLYRLIDLKGIDQISVFSVLACSGSHTSLMFIRSLNLMIWITIPNLLILIMCLIIIYSIKLSTQKNKKKFFKTRRLKYNRTTKIVLFISIFTLILHTPIGIINILDAIYVDSEQILIFLTIFILRKLSLILYQISLCCKFFIYNQLFRDFKRFLKISMSPLTHRTNSADLGRPFFEYLQDCPSNRKISFVSPRRLTAIPQTQRDLFMKSCKRHPNTLCERHQRICSTNQGYQLINCYYD